MPEINITTLTGRLVRDPQIRVAESGATWAMFTMASNHRFKDGRGELRSETAFLDCKAFGRSAEQLRGLHKGDPLVVSGRLRTESWVKEGKPCSRLTLVCDAANGLAPANGNGLPAGEPKEPAMAGNVPEDDKDHPPF